MNTLLHFISFTCLSFSIVGFIELAFEFIQTKTYILSHAVVYCVLFGIGIALL